MEDLKINYDFYCKKNISANIKPVILYYENEIWDLTGWYSCSDNGIVWSEDRMIKCRNGGERFCKGKFMRPQFSRYHWQYHNQKHLSVTIKQNGKHKTVKLHKIIANTFLGCPNRDYEISHLNHNPLNNNLYNLNYKTIKDHRIYDTSGINNGRAWIQDNIIQEIRDIYNNNIITDMKKIAIKFNIPHSTIWRWIHYKNR